MPSVRITKATVASLPAGGSGVVGVGTVLTVSEHEANALLRHGKAVIVMAQLDEPPKAAAPVAQSRDPKPSRTR